MNVRAQAALLATAIALLIGAAAAEGHGVMWATLAFGIAGAVLCRIAGEEDE